MTDKEFKRLGRAQLIDIIYELQLQVNELTKRNQQLEQALEDRRLRIDNAGSLAAAALEINDFFNNAQVAAEQYLNEIKALRETTEVEQQQLHSQAEAEFSEAQEKANRLVTEAQTEASRLLLEAQERATSMLDAAKKAHQDYDTAVELILREYELDR